MHHLEFRPLLTATVTSGSAHQDRVDVSGGAVVELGHGEGDRLLQLKSEQHASEFIPYSELSNINNNHDH